MDVGIASRCELPPLFSCGATFGFVSLPASEAGAAASLLPTLVVALIFVSLLMLSAVAFFSALSSTVAVAPDSACWRDAGSLCVASVFSVCSLSRAGVGIETGGVVAEPRVDSMDAGEMVMPWALLVSTVLLLLARLLSELRSWEAVAIVVLVRLLETVAAGVAANRDMTSLVLENAETLLSGRWCGVLSLIAATS